MCRLGLLALTLGDGTIHIISVPQPAHVAHLVSMDMEEQGSHPDDYKSSVLSVSIDDLASVTLALGERTSAMTICWSPHVSRLPMLAAGTTKG
jgi:hypothetical protein